MGVEVEGSKPQGGAGGALGGGALALVPYRVVSLSLVRSDGAPRVVNEWSLRECLGPLLRRACGRAPADEADVSVAWAPGLDRQGKGEPIGEVAVTMWRSDAELVPRIVEKVQRSEVRVEGGVKLLVTASEKDPHTMEAFEKQWESQEAGKPGAGRRPDTLCVRGVPSRWLAEQRVSTKQPSLLVAHSVFSPLGAIKHIEISPSSTPASTNERGTPGASPGGPGQGGARSAKAGGGAGAGGGGGGGAGAGGGGLLGLKLLSRLKLNSDVAIQFEDHDEFLKALKALSNHAMAQADSGAKGEGGGKVEPVGGGKGAVRYGLEWLGGDYFEERNVRRRRFEREAEAKEESMRKEREEEGKRRRQREAEEAERRKREEEERARKEAEEEEERRRKEEEEERLRREEEERLRREAEEAEEARLIAEEEERLREEEEERQRLLEEEEERAARQREEEEEKRRVEEEVLLRLQEQVKRAAAAAAVREEGEGRRGGGRGGRGGYEEERERRGERGFGGRREREDWEERERRGERGFGGRREREDEEERGGDWRNEYRGAQDPPRAYADREQEERGGKGEGEYRGRDRERERGRGGEEGDGPGYGRGQWGRGGLEEREAITGGTDRAPDTAQDRAQYRAQARHQERAQGSSGDAPALKRRRMRSVIVMPDADTLSLVLEETAEGSEEGREGAKGVGEDGFSKPPSGAEGGGLEEETAHEGGAKGEVAVGEEGEEEERSGRGARAPVAKTKAEEIRLRNELLKRFPPKAGKARAAQDD